MDLKGNENLGYNQDSSLEKKKDNLSIDPVKRNDDKEKNYAKKDDEEEDLGGYFPSRRNNRLGNKEDGNKRVKFVIILFNNRK